MRICLNGSSGIRVIALVMLLSSSSVMAQSLEAYPPHWWVGMKWNTVQVLIRSPHEKIADLKVHVKYDGVVVKKVSKLDNARYLAIDLEVGANVKPGNVSIELTGPESTRVLDWTLHERRPGNGTRFAQGLTPADVVYLLMPDRFSNGDLSNDRIAGMRDQSLNRDSIYYRHGGDLQGVINHLAYLQSLGVTAIWMTPVLENDMPDRTEHGYAITNHYRVDPRLGGRASYKELSDELHKRGMKLIQDAVYNHVGLYHTLVQDKPVKDWLHEWPTYTGTNYRDALQFDPHASSYENKLLADGWFTPMMPDLNHENELQANYLIQHAIWCVEEFGVDAWRIDTYFYNNLEFMNRCNQALIDEYPSIFLFGETMVHGPVNQAYFAKNNLNTNFKSNLHSVTDFQSLFHGITPALMNPHGGLNELYGNYSFDFLYQDPNRLVTLLDNHDINRFYTQVGEDVRKHKMGLGWLLTNRGIPQLYYGSEVMMRGASHPRDGWVRLDFPGGWPNDKKNAVTQQGLTAQEKDIQNFVKTVGQFRKNSSALQTGKMKHFIPRDGHYVYFRYDETQTIMVVMNVGDESREIDFSDYSEATLGFTKSVDILTKQSHGTAFVVEPLSITILELKK